MDSRAGSSAARALSVASTSSFHLRFQRFDLALVQNPFAHQKQRKLRQRIALRFRRPLRFASYKVFRRPKGNVNKDESRGHEPKPDLCACGNVPPPAAKPHNSPATQSRRILPHANADNSSTSAKYFRLASVLPPARKSRSRYPQSNRAAEAFAACRIQRFVEFAFARRAVPRGNVHHFIAMERDGTAHRRLARLIQSLGEFFVVAGTLRRARRLQKLCPGREKTASPHSNPDAPSAKASAARRTLGSSFAPTPCKSIS